MHYLYNPILFPYTLLSPDQGVNTFIDFECVEGIEENFFFAGIVTVLFDAGITEVEILGSVTTLDVYDQQEIICEPLSLVSVLACR